MIEFRRANEEDGVMDYLIEWGEIPQNRRVFYHLYVDGVKKDNTLYVCHLFDKAYSFGTHEEDSLHFNKEVIHITNGLALVHKMVEWHYSEEVMRKCHKDGKEDSDKCFNEVQVLINSNGTILFEGGGKYEFGNYYYILSDRLFSVSKNNSTTNYYRIEEHRAVHIFEGFEKMKSNNCVYGHPIKDDNKYALPNTDVVYKLNKISLSLELD